jgi:hypothetical protein
MSITRLNAMLVSTTSTNAVRTRGTERAGDWSLL